MQVIYADVPGSITYGMVFRMSDGQVWNVVSGEFEGYDTLSILSYDLGGSEKGTASGIYGLTFPAAITDNGGYKVIIKRQVGAPAAESDPVIWEETVWWSGSIATPPASPSPSPDQVTGYLYTYDPVGVIEEGVSISIQAVRFVEDEELGELSGAAIDDTVRTVLSDPDGLVSFPGLFKGVVYQVWRGTGSKYNIEIPLDEAEDPIQLPAIIGKP